MYTKTKGQLISKGLFGVIIWTKKPSIFLKDFCPYRKIKKVKTLIRGYLT